MNERLRLNGASVPLLIICVILPLAACSSNEVTTGIKDNRFTPCPGTPNCVSSDATDEEHRVAPYRLKVAPQQAWHGLQNVIAAQPRKRLVSIDAASNPVPTSMPAEWIMTTANPSMAMTMS